MPTCSRERTLSFEAKAEQLPWPPNLTEKRKSLSGFPGRSSHFTALLDSSLSTQWSLVRAGIVISSVFISRSRKTEAVPKIGDIALSQYAINTQSERKSVATNPPKTHRADAAPFFARKWDNGDNFEFPVSRAALFRSKMPQKAAIPFGGRCHSRGDRAITGKGKRMECSLRSTSVPVRRVPSPQIAFSPGYGFQRAVCKFR